MNKFSFFVFSTIISIVMFFTTGFVQAQTQYQDGTPRINKNIQKKNYQTALSELEAHIQKYPNDVQAQFKRGTLLALTQQDNQAIAIFEALIQKYPELPEPYTNLAALYAKQGRYLEARSLLETASHASPSFSLTQQNLGDVYLRLAYISYQKAQQLKANDELTRRIHALRLLLGIKDDVIVKTTLPNTLKNLPAWTRLFGLYALLNNISPYFQQTVEENTTEEGIGNKAIADTINHLSDVIP